MDRIKLSNNAEKLQHQVRKMFTVLSIKTNKAEGDYITLEHEDPYEESPLKLFHPVHTYKMKFIKTFIAKDLHHDIFKNGQLVYEMPSEGEAQTYLRNSLNYLWDENKRHLNPQEYPVDLSTACWENKHKRILKLLNMLKRWRKKMSNLQDIVVREMKVKPEIESKVETKQIVHFIKVIYNPIHLYKH